MFVKRLVLLFVMTLSIATCTQKTRTKTIGIIVLNDFEDENIEYIIDNIQSYYKCK